MTLYSKITRCLTKNKELNLCLNKPTISWSTNKDHAHAKNLYEEILQLDQNNIDAYNSLAQWIQNLSKNHYFNNIDVDQYFLEWKQLYEKALEIDPDDYITNFYIGILYYKVKADHPDFIHKALEYLLKAEQVDSNTAVLFNIAVVYDEIANYKDSEKYYLKIIDVNKENDNEIIADAIREQNLKVYNNLAILSKKQDNIDDTIRYYKEGLNIDSKNFTFLYNLGLILMNIGRCKQAIKLFNKAILCKIAINNY